MVGQAELLEKVKSYNPEADLDKIKAAFDLCVKSHGGQKRASGDPYYTHPFEVAEILADFKLDTSTIITALLHDTVEDTSLTLSDIEEQFGVEIKKLVDGVTKLTKIEKQPKYIAQAENYRKLLFAMSEDIRVLLVKLADRLHNMRTLKFISRPEKRLRIAHETMEIFVPLAERIGMERVKIELQDLAFTELNPDARNSIVSRLEYLRKQDKNLVNKIVSQITEVLKDQGLNDFRVYGREKTPCSIWQKMQKKNISFEQLTDIMAYRVIVKDITDCYSALGVIHSKYHMIPESFKDFISTPKDNGYKSIHTIVMGPEQHQIEVQIRTEKMHEINEMGVAAHWSYKQDYQFDPETDGREFRWIRELLDILEHSTEPEDVLENTKLDMYHDQVFCFTPKGNLISLPFGATPVDFGYAVHSDVGRTCVGAKVNGRIVPLRTQLKNGDQVEIIRSKSQIPSPAWEKFVVTAKARTDIKRFIRMQQRHEYINLGKAILTKTLRSEGVDHNEKSLESVLDILKKKTIDDLYLAVGDGTLSRVEVVNALFPDRKNKKETKSKLSFFKFGSNKKPKKDTSIPIKGLIPGMAMHFAGCCHPIPGDRIVGIVHTGRGITIHTSDCEMLDNFSSTPERWIDVSWEKEIEDNYIGRIKTLLINEPDAFATLTQTIAKEFGNITNLKIINRTTDFFEVLVDIEVRGQNHLTNIIASLRSKSQIQSVERYKL